MSREHDVEYLNLQHELSVERQRANAAERALAAFDQGECASAQHERMANEAHLKRLQALDRAEAEAGALVMALESIALVVKDVPTAELADGRTIIARTADRVTDIVRAALASGARAQAVDRPRIVCLCGSTRFMDWFHEAGWQETMAGKIVLSVGCSKHLPADHGGEAMGPEVAARLDELHLRKIDLADEILVLNVGGYVGESTQREVEYAERTGKPIRWLELPPLNRREQPEVGEPKCGA